MASHLMSKPGLRRKHARFCDLGHRRFLDYFWQWSRASLTKGGVAVRSCRALSESSSAPKSHSAVLETSGVSLSEHACEILARASVVTIPETREATGKAPEAKNLYELFAPVRGLLTDQEIDFYFSRTPSASIGAPEAAGR